MSGPYSSSSRAVLDRQMAEISAAGVDEVISSWWGWGSAEDQRLPAVIAAANAHGLEVAVHLEPYPGRTVSTLEQDVDHLKALGIYEFYVYQPQDLPAADWKDADVEGVGRALLRPDRAAGVRGGRRLRRALHLRHPRLRGLRRSAGSAPRRGRSTSCARRRSAPATTPSARTGDTRVKPRRRRRDLRLDVARGPRRRRPTSSRSRATTSGTRAPRSSPRRPLRAGAMRPTRAPTASATADAPYAYLARTAYWTGVAAAVAARRG